MSGVWRPCSLQNKWEKTAFRGRLGTASQTKSSAEGYFKPSCCHVNSRNCYFSSQIGIICGVTAEILPVLFWKIQFLSSPIDIYSVHKVLNNVRSPSWWNRVDVWSPATPAHFSPYTGNTVMNGWSWFDLLLFGYYSLFPRCGIKLWNSIDSHRTVEGFIHPVSKSYIGLIWSHLRWSGSKVIGWRQLNVWLISNLGYRPHIESWNVELTLCKFLATWDVAFTDRSTETHECFEQKTIGNTLSAWWSANSVLNLQLVPFKSTINLLWVHVQK